MRPSLFPERLEEAGMALAHALHLWGIENLESQASGADCHQRLEGRDAPHVVLLVLSCLVQVHAAPLQLLAISE